MANLARLRSLPSLLSRRPYPASSQWLAPVRCRVSTCDSKNNTSTAVTKLPPSDDTAATFVTPGVKPKCWQSFGFSDESEYEDRHYLNVTFFLSVTMCITVVGFLLAYMPDHRYRDWAQREAYIVLRDRESKGLPPIDKNLIDPALIKLPPDEMLENEHIII